MTRRIVVEGLRTPVPTPPATPVPDNAIRRGVLFQGIHVDTNPSENVRTAHMTCPGCDTNFRYFTNSDGKKTVVRCPSCAQTYRA